MSIVIDEIRCPQNHRCPAIRVCPADAISQNNAGLPIIDMSKCTECGKCTRYCPMGAIRETA
ncbi:MAG: 4Fe-4S binding protein [Bacteroidota bacterium]